MNKIDDAKMDRNEHLESLKYNPNLGRRFVLGTLPVGFAMAVGPVRAEVIKTDDKGLDVGEVKIKTTDTTIPGYRARPANAKNAPVVLVIEEIFGVHEWIKDVCRRLAKEGYYAIAPELFARQGDATKYEDMQKLFADIISKVDDTQTRVDMDATIAFAKSEGANVDKLAMTGFCYGGRQTWLYTAQNPNVKAGVAWYGGMLPGRIPAKVEAIQVADKIKGRVLGLYGGQDTGIPLEHVEKMREALKAAGDTKSEIVVYPDAPHGFLADYRPSYREEPSKDGWKKMLAWFKSHGVA
jgi:carboxymethylenebutenolidase